MIRQKEESLEPRSGAIIAPVADSLISGSKSEEDQVEATHMIKAVKLVNAAIYTTNDLNWAHKTDQVTLAPKRLVEAKGE